MSEKLSRLESSHLIMNSRYFHNNGTTDLHLSTGKKSPNEGHFKNKNKQTGISFSFTVSCCLLLTFTGRSVVYFPEVQSNLNSLRCSHPIRTSVVPHGAGHMTIPVFGLHHRPFRDPCNLFMTSTSGIVQIQTTTTVKHWTSANRTLLELSSAQCCIHPQLLCSLPIDIVRSFFLFSFDNL